jgi:hypothetical protein
VGVPPARGLGGGLTTPTIKLAICYQTLHTTSDHDRFFADQVQANEVGGACGTHGRGQESLQSFCGKARRKETTRKTKT